MEVVSTFTAAQREVEEKRKRELCPLSVQSSSCSNTKTGQVSEGKIEVVRARSASTAL